MQPNTWEPTAGQFLRWHFNDRDKAKEAALNSYKFYGCSGNAVAIYRSKMLIIAIQELSSPPSAG